MPVVSAEVTGIRLIRACLRFLEAHEQVMAVVNREKAENKHGTKWARTDAHRSAVKTRKEFRQQMLEVARSYRAKRAREDAALEAAGMQRRRRPGEPKRGQRPPGSRGDRPATRPTVAEGAPEGRKTDPDANSPAESDDGIAPV